ncbi:MAG: hypothetical protein HIU85_04730 [Proteobacteria bacterium]|nr:hypothetical protein [Pseudomonadota bacterium]
MALGVTTAYGKECKGISFPDHAHVQGALLTLNGLGLRKARVFKVSVYVVALYLTEPSSDPHLIPQSDTPSELVLQFIRRVSAHQLRRSWEEGFGRNFPEHPPALEKGLAQLNSWVTDVRSGQRMTFIRIPGTGMQVDINGTVKGIIAGDEFSKAFLSIWFGDSPQTPELKRGLLGGPCE